MVRSLSRFAFFLVIFLSVLLTVAVLTLRFAVLPNIESYRADIVRNVANASGMAVSAKSLRGGWEGFRPFVELADVRFSDPKTETDAPALVMPALHASLSWWALLLGEVRFHEVTLDAPELVLQRMQDGVIYFAGKPLNQKRANDDARLLPWLLEQPQLVIHDAALQWQDDMTGAAALRLTKLDLRIEKSGRRHRIGLRATPPRDIATSLEAQGMLEISKNQAQWELSGTLYANTTQASLAQWRRHLPIPDTIREATGNVRAWIDFDPAQPHGVKTITADVNVVNVIAQFSKDLAPLALPRLAGRVEYRAEPGGFNIGSRALQFRTSAGIQLTPADFSVSLIAEPGKVARGEMTGNGIDLKVVAALVNFFPVGKGVREAVARYAPRGAINQASVSWSGEFTALQSYRVKGRFADLAFNADGKIPGVEGLSGSIEGDESGGQFSVASKNIKLDIGQVFRAPLFFETLEAGAKWKKSTDKNTNALALEFSKIMFANAEVAGEVNGAYRSGGKGPGMVDFKGTLARGDAAKIANYLPNSAQKTRTWLENALPAGKINSAQFELRGDLWDFPFKDDKDGKFLLSVKAEDVRFKFLPDWPTIDNIKGDIVFAGSHISVKPESATIFDSQIARTTIVEVDDTTSWTPLLTVNGMVNASAQDVARYLKESPLAEGVGKFTQIITMDGPGRLDLKLSVPLGSRKADVSNANAPAKERPPLRVSGRYEFLQARIKPPLGAMVTNVSGSIQFTERSVISQGLSGQVYGNPLQITLSGGGEEGVAIDLSGRTEITNLNDVLPFRLPSQIEGVTDWKGRIVARSSRVDMTFTSELLGVTSGLPSPLAKRPEQPLKLVAEFSELGKNSETIHVQLGEIAYGRFARRFDDKGQPSGLAGGLISLERPIGSQPLPEGLWLVGNMPELDIDRWKATFGAASQPAASAGDSPGSNTFTGFDLAVTRMLAFGREFKSLQLKGRRVGDDWRVTVSSPELAGDALWRPAADAGRGYIRARLNNFVLNAEQAQAAVMPADSGERTAVEFPSLDIEAEHFTFRGYELGKLEFKAAMDGMDWRIDRLLIEGSGSKLDTSGRWTRAEGQSHTELKVKVESNNLNGLFRTFGHADTLKRGAGQLEGTLGWPGYPYEFALNNLVGEFKLDARKGQFAKIEPGAGRLLGLISLQAIPRRVTLDFRDIFSEGFGFDRIGGTIKIDKGIMRTEDFEIAGSSAFVTMQGEVSLPSETQNLRMTVIPSLGEGVSVITALIGGPVVGLTTLLVQKLLQDPIGRVAGYQYNVTGTWDNPDVVRLARNAAPATNVIVDPQKNTP